MELVPIIYTALVIVALIAIITIIISYTSHKIRQKKGLIDSPSIEKAQRVIDIKKINTKPSIHPKQIQPKESSGKPFIEKRKETPKQPELKDRQEKKKTIPKNDRIEIVKTVLPSQNPDEIIHEQNVPTPFKKSSEEVKLQTLGEKIIDKYDDDNTDAIYPLKVEKKKNEK